MIIAALRHMTRQPRKNDPSEPRHAFLLPMAYLREFGALSPQFREFIQPNK
jgi:hypothetical protein